MYDIAIIGAGPGGYVAAIKAARNGLKTILIEKHKAGGVCLNSGCVPTKTIIASVEKFRAVKKASEFGIDCSEATPDIKKIIARKNAVVEGLNKGVDQLLKANKVERVDAHARLTGANLFKAGDKEYKAKNIILATGSVWKTIKGLEPDGNFIITSDELLEIKKIPESMVILGGGVVGCEFASIFSALGTKVTIVEALDSILPMEDTTTSNLLKRAFKKSGIDILTGISVKSASNGVIELSNGKSITAEKLLVAVGRRPNFDGLGVEEVGIKTERGAITTDSHMRTNINSIYAIGDVNGKYMLAHVASQEGLVAVKNILGEDTEMSYEAIPRPIYTYPEICAVGLTEKDLTENKIAFKTGKFGFMALSKAVCDGETEGQAVIYSEEKGGRVLGAQIVGKNATEISSEIVLAVANGLTVADIANAIHSHPTISEAVREAAEDCEGVAIHKVYR